MTKPTMRLLSALLALPLLALGARAAHAVPNTVSFTARITDPAGAPVTGPLTLKVAVFDAATAGTMVWEETHTDVPVANGLVYASLGGVDAVNNGLDGTVLDGRALFVELTVDGDVLSPRIPIESVPYAVRSAVADTLQGFDPSTVQQRVTGTCATGNYITAVGADGTVTCAPDATNTGDITGVTGTGGITGGGTSGAVSLSIDTAVIQARVTGTCATGNYITAIAANGSVTCAADASNAGDITGVTAGTGLTGGGTTGAVALSVDTGVIQARVTGTCTTGNFITAIGANGAVTCAAESGGDITGVTAGGGLTGGGASGTVALSVDTAVIQARVTGTCTTGNYITAINANGTVACAPDASNTGDITGVTAGTGLTGGGTTGAVSLAVDTSVIQARIGTSCGAGTFMTGVSAAGAPICATDTVGTGDITDVVAGAGLTGGAAAGSATLAIANLGVTSAMLATGAVTSGKIAVDAVGPNEIAANAVGTSEIATNAVTTAKILDGSVTMAKTSAPIGMAEINVTPPSTQASTTIFPNTVITPDANGSCFVTAWADDASSNIPFYLEPAIQTVSSNASTFPGALVQSSSGGFGGYSATASAVMAVTSGTAIRFGCHLAGFSLPGSPDCRVSWTCN
ncbi:MAG: hypothetical protein K8W52_24210 [Deltaproteobacteria bacterium]|nr:hypothetical protein [Deltaproteobacteria bacterium]